MDKIKAVLEELYWDAHSVGVAKIMPREQERISQVLTKLDALYKEKYLGMLPEEKATYQHKQIKLGGEWVEETDARYNCGFNLAIQEFKRRVG